MNTDSSTIESLNFANFIKNVHGGAGETMLRNVVDSPQLYSVSSRTYSTTSPMSDYDDTSLNTILKYVLFGLVIYLIYSYLFDPKVRRTVANIMNNIKSLWCAPCRRVSRRRLTKARMVSRTPSKSVSASRVTTKSPTKSTTASKK